VKYLDKLDKLCVENVKFMNVSLLKPTG